MNKQETIKEIQAIIDLLENARGEMIRNNNIESDRWITEAQITALDIINELRYPEDD